MQRPLVGLATLALLVIGARVGLAQTVSRMQCREDSVAVAIGAKAQIHCQYRATSGKIHGPSSWFTRSGGYATITGTDTTGTLTGVARGLTWAGGSRYGYRDSVRVWVKQCSLAAAPMAGAGLLGTGPVTVVVEPPTLTFEAGQPGQTLQGYARDDCGTVTGATWSWVSRNTSVATVTGTRSAVTVTPVAVGQAYVVGSSGTPKDSSLVTVNNPPNTCTSSASVICPGDDWLAKLAAKGQNAVFTIWAGVHWNQSVDPKSGVQLIAQPGAIMDGGRVLTGWTSDGAGHWYVTGQTQENTDTGATPCASGHNGCRLPEQLWVNDTLQEHVTTLGAVTATKWFFDYPANRIYIGTNPASRTILTSVTVYAIGGSATGVVVKHLTVQHYANGAQRAAVGYNSGNSWLVDSNTVQDNHGIGIKTGGNSLQRGNLIQRMGQLGNSAAGTAPTVYGNTIQDNMTAFFGPGSAVECGGSKYVQTIGAIIRRNTYARNGCDGLWMDVNNRGALIDSNTVVDNDCTGILDEVGYGSKIRYNTVTGNGFTCTLGSVAGQPAGISVSGGPDMEIDHNTVANNKNGITGYEVDRPTPTPPAGYGAHDVLNLSVHDNTVTQTDAGIAGGIHDGDPNANPFSATANNDWFNNHYTVGASTKWRWTGNTNNLWTAWRGFGQDPGSTETGQ